MTRIPIDAGTPEATAKTLRGFAELTAKNTRNWDSYEAIVLDILKQIQAYYIGERERKHSDDTDNQM